MAGCLFAALLVALAGAEQHVTGLDGMMTEEDTVYKVAHALAFAHYLVLAAADFVADPIRWRPCPRLEQRVIQDPAHRRFRRHRGATVGEPPRLQLRRRARPELLSRYPRWLPEFGAKLTCCIGNIPAENDASAVCSCDSSKEGYDEEAAKWTPVSRMTQQTQIKAVNVGEISEVKVTGDNDTGDSWTPAYFKINTNDIDAIGKFKGCFRAAADGFRLGNGVYYIDVGKKVHDSFLDGFYCFTFELAST